uniref:glycosyltransferase family 4 protein n=1 Tax=Staphylococcus sp. GDY8P76P TaxID=2804426 RepID=UPI0031BAB226
MKLLIIGLYKERRYNLEILHINSNYLHSGLYSEMLYQLNLKNINNTVVMPRKNNDEKNVANNLINSNIILKDKQFLSLSDRFLYFSKQRKITDWLNEENINFDNYDVIHAHTLFSDGYQAYTSNNPYVVTVRNTDVNYYFKYFKHLKPVAKKILTKASAIVFLSESYKDKAIEHLFKNEEAQVIIDKSYIIPNGINEFWIEHMSQIKKTIDETINIIIVCRIMKNKNIEILAENLTKECIGKNISIHVVGDIVDKNYFDNLQKYNNLIFHGKKSKVEIRELMKDMHIFMMLSHNETFGLVYLEAITQNLPVIYTKGEGFDRYFNEGTVGYASNSKDGTELIKQTHKMIKNYACFQQQLNCLDKQQFSWEHNAERHKNIYESIMLRE